MLAFKAKKVNGMDNTESTSTVGLFKYGRPLKAIAR